MEFADTSLEVLLARGVRLTNSSIRKLLFQILEALDFLHSMDVVHRDIKPSNVLVNNNGIVKLCDFGLARHITSKAINNAADLEEYVCTRWYRPPELFWGWDSYGVAIDLWSLGCVVAEIINLKALFPGSNSKKFFYVILNFIVGTQQLNFFNEVLGYPSEDVLSRMKLSQAKDYALTLDSTASSVKFHSRFPVDTDHLLINLMRSWLQYDPALRLSAEDSLKHNYFSGFRHETVPKVDFSLPWDNEELSFNQKLNILSTERKLLSGKPLQMITPTKNVPELRVNLSPNTIKSPLWRESFEEWSTLNIPSADVLSPPSLEDD